MADFQVPPRGLLEPRAIGFHCSKAAKTTYRAAFETKPLILSQLFGTWHVLARGRELVATRSYCLAFKWFSRP